MEDSYFQQQKRISIAAKRGTESTKAAGINVNTFYANIGKFLTSQVFNYKSRSKHSIPTENATGKPMTNESHFISNNNIQTNNHFTSLMEKNMVLGKPTNHPSEDEIENKLKTNTTHIIDTYRTCVT